MKPETAQWVRKAEGDWKVAQREMRHSDPVWDVVCFLSQQCAEKYLKAFLEEQSITFRKTHDLIVLVDAAAGYLSELDSMRPQLSALGAFGIVARYPGTDAEQAEAEDALRAAGDLRTAMRVKLGLALI